MSVPANSVKEFVHKVLGQPFLKNFTLMNYGEDTWSRIEGLLKSKM